MKKEMTTLQKIKEMLELSKVQYSLARTTTSSGVVVETEGDFEIGKEVFVVAEDGTTSPAPDGEHTLPELGIIIQTEGGVCIEIAEISSEQAEEIVDEAELAVTPEEQTAIITEIMQILDPRFEQMNAIHAQLMLRIDELEAKMNEGMMSKVNELTSKVEQLSKQPGEKSKTTIDEYNKIKKQTFEDTINKFRSIKRK